MRATGLAAAARRRATADGRTARRWRDGKAAFILCAGFQRAAQRVGDTVRNAARDFHKAFVHADADRTDISPRHMCATAQQGQQPARIGIVPAPGIDAEPHAILETLSGGTLGALRPGAALALGRSGVGDQFLWSGKRGAMGVDEQRGNFLRAALFKQLRCNFRILTIRFDRCEQPFDEAGAVGNDNLLRCRRLAPFGLNTGIAQQQFDTAAAGIGDD